MILKLCTLITITVSLLGAAPTTPGTLDITFNQNGTGTGQAGTVTTPFVGNATGNSVAIQTDGKIVVAGKVVITVPNLFALARYNTDGSLDTTFNPLGLETGQAGTVATPFGANAIGNSVAIQTDGKIVVAGYAGAQFALARYNTDGSLDSTFNPMGLGTARAGTVTTPIGANATGYSVTIQTDAKIIVAGYANNQFAIARYNTDGSLDNTFNSMGSGTGQAGTVTTSIGANTAGYSVAIQADGKIIVTGRTTINGIVQFALARYNTNGSLDTTFNPTGSGTGQAGTVATSIGLDAIGNSTALQLDGKIVVAGKATINGVVQFALARYNTNGSLDTTFNPMGSGTGQAGTVATPIGLDTTGSSAALQSDGKIVVAGYTNIEDIYYFALICYNTNGSLDTTFNSTGPIPGITTTLIVDSSQGLSVKLQQDGKIVVAGYNFQGGLDQRAFAVARYNNIGALVDLAGKQTEERYSSQADLVNRLYWQAVTYATSYRITANGQTFATSGLPNLEVHNVRPGNRIAYTVTPLNASGDEGMPASITLG